MADIALLVAEEYERRVRNISRNKVIEAENHQEINLVSSLAVLVQKVVKKSIIGQGRRRRIEVVNLAFEPKSQIGVAAFNGAFSA